MVGSIVLWLLMDGLILAIFVAMPVVRGEDAFFGVRVSPADYRGSGRQIVRRYWFWLVLTFLEVEAIGIAVSMYRSTVPYSRTLSFPLLLAAFLVLYVLFYRQAKALELVEERQRVASSLVTRRLADFTSIPLEAAVIGLSIVPVLVLVYFYPSLPDRIPAHWNLMGEVDRWTKKGFGSVFLLPVIQIYLQGLFLLMKHGLLRVKMTLPAERAEEYFRYKSQALRINLQVMDWLRILIAVMLGSLAVSIVLENSDRLRPFKTVTFALVSVVSLVLLAVCGYLIYRMVSINRKLRAEVGRVYVQSQTDAAHWHWGGLFYYNPEDPALFVEKLVGWGYTVNLGNKSALIYAAYVLAMPLLSIWIANSF